MNTSIDREKLTAYVLGELDEAEIKAIEAVLAEDAEARALAEELRMAAEWTKDVFAHEPTLALAEDQRQQVRQQAGRSAADNVFPFRRVVWTVLGTAAAAGLVLVGSQVLSALARAGGSASGGRPMRLAHLEKDKATEPQVVRERLAEAPKAEVKAEPAKWPAPAPAAAAPPSAPESPAEVQLQQGGDAYAGAAPAPSERGDGAAVTWDSLPAGTQSAQVVLGEGLDHGMPAQSAPMKAKPEVASVDRLQALGYLENAQSAPTPGGQMGGMGEGRVISYGHVLPPNASLPELQPSSPYNDPSKNYWPGHNTEAYAPIVENPFLAVTQNPLSTFSIDVDTASYSNLRRFLEQGTFPPPDSVRIEELVNYFTYNYEPPKDKETPFAARVAIADCPWKPEHRLARVGIKGWEMPAQERPSSNLVFLLDVSGSMQPENKLSLVKKSMRMLAERLDERDRVAIVVYAGSSGLVLPSTTGDRKEAILDALSRLEAGGSTQGSAGIQLAYETAVANFVKGGVNRVILCTDGDFNVGVTNEGDLTRIIEEKAKSGVFLSVLGFGMGNLKDSMMEKLADKGNGNYAYIDTENEARKVLVDQMQGTLVTIAKDVKIQMEFNPALVSAYRLIGYENRMLRAEDFNDDKKDAGEIGAGHTVTALYEIVPAGQAAPTPAVDALKYQQVQPPAPASTSGEMFTLKIRYKKPDGDVSTKLEFPIRDEGMRYAQADVDFKFAAAVAEFGMLLRGSENKGNATFGAALELAQEGRGNDPHDYRLEFINLVKKAMGLHPEPVAPRPAIE